MRIEDIKMLTDIVNGKNGFSYQKTYEDRDVIVYTASKNISISGLKHSILIDINFYKDFNIAVMIMTISKGFWGESRDRIGELLLRINSIIKTGSFAVWQPNGNIIFKNDIPLEYLDPSRLIQNVSFFEMIYVSIKPRLEAYAKQLSLRHMTDDEYKQIVEEMNKFYSAIQRKLT